MASILSRLQVKNKAKLLQSSSINFAYHNFSTQTTQDQQSNLPEAPPVFEYQAPKDDYKNFQSTQQFIKRYLILFPIAALCLYDMLCVRRNRFTKQRELKFGGQLFEQNLVGPIISGRIVNKHKQAIYKQNTEEVEVVEKVLTKLIGKNNLGRNVPRFKVVVVHNENFIQFMNFDLNFFISFKILDMCQMDESKIALVISHELAHYLQDHQALRVCKSIFANVIFLKLIGNKQKKELYDPVRELVKKKILLQRYSCFYPHQKVITKYYEKNCDLLAIQLWKQAYPDLDYQTTIDQVYGAKFEQFVNSQPIDELEKRSRSYNYKRGDVNKQLARAELVN